MKKLKILITTIGGLTSPDILHALRSNGEREVEIHGTDAFRWAVCFDMVDSFTLCPSSTSDEEGFVRHVKELCQKHDYDLIIPCGNEDNLALAKYKSEFATPILVSEYDALLAAYDKGAVYELLAQHLPEHAPRFYFAKNLEQFHQALKNLDFPSKKVVVKPRFGRGGRGVYILNDSFSFKDFFSKKPESEIALQTLEAILEKEKEFEELILMECLQEEFVSAYSLCSKGQNLLTLKHIREWGNASQTYRGRVSYDPTLEALCSKVIELFRLDYTNNMELAYSTDGRLVLFDLNPRIGASSGVDCDIGFNFPYLAIKLLLGESFTLKDKTLLKDERFMRYFSCAWVQNK